MIVEGERSVHPRKLSAVQCALPDESRNGQSGAERPVIPRRANAGPAPLSFVQERLWHLEQLEPGNPLYHAVVAVRLDGELEEKAFEQAWEELVRRHAQLRTTFSERAGNLVASVAPMLTGMLTRINVEASWEEAGRRLASEDARRPFKRDGRPLLRASLFHLAEHTHVFVLVAHRMILDEASEGLILDELRALYEAFARGHSAPSFESLEYEDFAAWQRAPEQIEAHAKPLAFWQRQLAGSPALLNLPCDRPRPAAQSYRGGREKFTLDPRLSDALRLLGTAPGANPDAALLAAAQVLLLRYTGSDDIVLGTPGTHRTSETARCIGNFDNVLVLRTDLSGDPIVRELIRRAGETLSNAQAHGQVPFERLIQELAPEPHRDRHPLFQAAIVFEHEQASQGQTAGVNWTRVELELGTTAVDLEFLLRDDAPGINGQIQYSSDLFDPGTIRRMLGHWEMLLKEMAQSPERRISELRLMTADEELAWVSQASGPVASYPRERCVHHLFEQQARRTPDAVAVEFQDQQLTYGQLERRATRLAKKLQQLQVGPDVPVGIALERSLEVPVAVLGVLKAGGAYVPLDPAYPSERLRLMLENSRVAIVLTQSFLQPQLEAGLPKVEWICLDALPEAGEGEAASETPQLAQVVNAEHLAYVIHTSGSTGVPKGVAMPHRPLVNLISWQLKQSPANAATRTLQFASLSFDVSFQEMFTTWCAGGTLVLMKDELRREPRALLTFLAEKGIERLFLPFVALQHLAEAFTDEAYKIFPASLREVITAGEQLQITPKIVELFARLPGCVLHNHYGPTESHVVTAFTLTGPPPEWPALPSIGRPIDNVQIFLLDGLGRPVPLGVPGELHIGGDALARGYLNKPEITAERFVPNGLRRSAPDSSERLYKTGDLARYRADGLLEFLGRMDHQVKIRGFRVELAEVETALQQHPSIREVVVTAHQDGSGPKRLVAYYVPSQDERLPNDEARLWLKQRLPEYMVPSLFIGLDALPLSPNGKVDRKRLPAPDASRPELHNGYAAPRTAEEKTLADIWQEVLGLKEVGAQDNFFDLGGHSLSAAQIISRVRRAFGVELSLASLFEAPTPAALAERLAAAKAEPSDTAPALRAETREHRAPLSFSQQRLWFIDQLAPGGSAYLVPVALTLEGTLDVGRLQECMQAIVRRHEVLRTRFITMQGEPAQETLSDAPVPWRQLELPMVPGGDDAKLRTLLDAEARQPFALTNAPLLRCTLVRTGEKQHVLLVVMHHIVSDGWSLAVLFEELTALYEARTENRPALLPELPVQYPDYALWQRAWLRGEVLEKSLAYFKDNLAGAPPAIALPVRKAAPASANPKGAERAVTLLPALVESLAQLQRREGTTFFMTLLAALAIVLQRWTRQNDLVVGTVAAGRDRPELEHLLGCFMNFLPLRLTLSGCETLLDVVRRAKTAVLAAHPHAACPFEKIVEAINPERRPNANPIYNVGLLLQNFPRRIFNMPQLRGRRLAVQTGDALLDLRFIAEETEEGTSLACEYPVDRFSHGTIDQLLAGFTGALAALAERPTTKLEEFALHPELSTTAAADPGAKGDVLAIAATFTAEPVEESLQYWVRELDFAAVIQFAPYNQVFQQLLDPASLMACNRRGLNVALIRLEDWQRSGADPGANAEEFNPEKIAATGQEFCAALKAAARRGAAEFLVCFCPSWKTAATHPESAAVFEQLEQELARELADISTIRTVVSRDLLQLYPVADLADPQGDRLGHIPYTSTFYASLGTLLARLFDAKRRARPKVIALDCDQTLWGGICGEDGPDGVRLDPPYWALQEFMRARRAEGALLCLCSKNQEQDVEAVFAHHPEMPLRREDFVAAKINWNAKSENLRALAQELNLGLDAFVLVDDSPVECAEVEANAPEVLALQLPREIERTPSFLKHCWIFDRWKLSAEDSQRTTQYQQNREREQLRSGSTSLKDFIDQLGLEVQIAELAPEQLVRAAQLTQKTNQFNFTTRRRSESEIVELQQQRQAEVLTASVKDRFGDYGLVGVVIFESGPEALLVDTFLLSCRVLGRGVEHRIVAHLGQLAQQRGARHVELPFRPSARNQPALEFAERIAAAHRQPPDGAPGQECVYRLRADSAASLLFTPSHSNPAEPPPTASGPSEPGSQAPAKFSRCAWIAEETHEPARLLTLVEKQTTTGPRPGLAYAEPKTELELKIADMWKELLRVERVSVNEDFFAMGGHSLLAVRLFAGIEKQLGVALPIVTIFQAPTVAQLARLVSVRVESSPPRLVPIQPEGTRPPLFLVHGAGGDILWGYANMARHLGQTQPIYGIQARATKGMKKFRTLEAMAADYLAEIRSVQPKGPYYVGGYCFGGNVAYEMARQLYADGQTVALVALMDCAPANTGYEQVQWWRPSFPFQFARNLCYRFADFVKLKPEQQRNFVGRKLRVLSRSIRRRWSGAHYGRTIDLEQVFDISQFPPQELELWQSHLRLLLEHVSQPYAGRVTLFRTRGHPLFSSYARDFGWGALAQSGVTVQFVPGSHESIFMEPNVSSLAKALEGFLGKDPVTASN